MAPIFGVLCRVQEQASATARQNVYRQVQNLGCTGIRIGIDRRALEPTAKGVYDPTALARLDAILGLTANDRGEVGQYGLRVCADIFRTPDWAKSTNPTYQSFESLKPASNQDFADFCGFIADRYKLSQPDMILGVFDEPNNGTISLLPDGTGALPFPPFPANEYADMVTRSTAAIKAACPTMIVLAGELWPMDSVYMTNVYATWGANKPAIDGWAIQAYCVRGFNFGDPSYRSVIGPYDRQFSVIDGMDACRSVMVANGHSALGVYVTEWGWQESFWSGNDQDPTDAMRAQFTKDLVQILLSRSWVTWISPFLLERQNDNARAYGMWIDNATLSGIPSQMFRAYKDIIAGKTSQTYGYEASYTRTSSSSRTSR